MCGLTVVAERLLLMSQMGGAFRSGFIERMPDSDFLKKRPHPLRIPAAKSVLFFSNQSSLNFLTTVFAVLCFSFAAQSAAHGQAKYGNAKIEKREAPSTGKGNVGKFFKNLFSRPTPPAPPNPPSTPGTSETHTPPPLVAPIMDELNAVPRSGSRMKRVFVLGDSQSHTEFGEEFQSQIALGGYEVLYHAVKNGSPYYWNGLWKSPVLTRIYRPAAEPESTGAWTEVSMRPHTVEEYVNLFDPDVFIFQAGTNFEVDLVSDSPTQIFQLTRKCIDMAASRGAKVLWIGPPDARDDKKSSEFQDKSVSKLQEIMTPISERQGVDSFFNSRPVCPMPNTQKGDGEHPMPTKARNWARSAASWSLASIRTFEKDRSFASRQSEGPIQHKNSPGTSPLAGLKVDLKNVTNVSMKLKLIAKSKIADPKTMDYTDSFSVFKYEILNATDVRKNLKGIELTTSPAGDKTYAYVMHWTLHNTGSSSPYTPLASKKLGSTSTFRVLPLERHPLCKTLETMSQINDFDDFGAPIFVSSKLLEEPGF